MAWNGSGTFTPVDTVEDATTATATEMNNIINDLGTGINTALAKDGQNVMTGALRLAAGTAAAPGLSFSADTDCGLYRIGANNLGISVNQTKILDIATTGLSVTGTLTPSGQIVSSAGTNSAPGYSFSGDLNTGVYAIGADNLGITAGGTKIIDVATTGAAITGTFSASGAATLSSTLAVTGAATFSSTVAATTVGVNEGSAPSTPASGKGIFFADTNGIAKFINDAGVVRAIGPVQQVVDATPYTTNEELSTTIPLDDSAPTSSEGHQILTAAITPSSTSSKVEIDFAGFGTPSGTGSVCIVALFRGTTCIYALAAGTNTAQTNLSFKYVDSPSTTSSATYSIRVGAPTGTSGIRMNGTFSARLFGGAAACTMRLTETL